jgi:alkaline phosphatase
MFIPILLILPFNLWENKERESSPRIGLINSYDQPGLKEMTLKAIDILHTRSQERNTGWMLMSEAAVGRQIDMARLATDRSPAH